MNMLEGFAFTQIEDLQPDIIFQHDGTPHHWALVVRAVLNEKFPGRWIGRDGPTAWSPQSPDITPLDVFFFCGGLSKMLSTTPRW